MVLGYPMFKDQEFSLPTPFSLKNVVSKHIIRSYPYDGEFCEICPFVGFVFFPPPPGSSVLKFLTKAGAVN